MRRAISLLSFLCLPLLLLLHGCGGTSIGTYGLNASASSLALTQGTTGTVTITLTTADKYRGTVSITEQGMPSGVTVTPTTATLQAGGSTTLTISAAATAAVGTTQVQVNGTSSDGRSANATIALTVNAAAAPPPTSTPQISLSASPASLTLAAGGFAQVTVTGTATSSVGSDIAVTITGLPAGVTASPATFSVAAGTPVTVTLIADATAAGTTAPATVTFNGTAGDLTTSASVMLNVTAAAPPVANNQDFSLQVTPATVTLAPGASAQLAVNSTPINGFSAPITVTIAGLPTGVTASPATLTLTPGVPQSVTLTADANAPATAEPVASTFTGVSGALTHMTTVAVSVTSVADFSLSVTPAAVSVAQADQSDAIQISTTSIHGLTGNVSIAVSGLPAGVTAIPSSSVLLLGNQAPMVFQASDTAAIGTANVTITATSGVLVHTAVVALTVTAPPPTTVTVTLSPSSVTVPQNGFGLLTISATSPDVVNITLQNLPSGVTASPATFSLDSGTSKTIVLTASGAAVTGDTTVTVVGQTYSLFDVENLDVQVTAAPSYPNDVPTWHYDAQRTGLRTAESVLTPTVVNATGFGRQSSWAADAAVDAQPLYAENVTIATQPHNVLYVATENDTVYALDAATGVPLWQSSALGSGETASDDRGCSEITPNIGISATPVIDRNYPSNGAIFFVALSKDGSGTYHQRLHGLDMTTGAELQGSPVEITGTYPGSGITSDGTTNTFDSSKYVERAALLLSNSTLYLSWSTTCQQTTPSYSSWVMAYSEPTLQQQSVLNLTPNGSGGSISMSAAGPAADLSGNVFLATGPGTFDTTLTTDGYFRPVNGDYGNAYMKLENGSTGLTAFDYFAPLDGIPGSATYGDQGTGGVMVIPDLLIDPKKGYYDLLLVGAGRDGNIYEMDRSGQDMGEYNGTADGNFETIPNALPNGATSAPAYFNGFVYYGGIGDVVKSFDATNRHVSTTSDRSTVTLGTAGATPVITANGTTGAILWVLDTGASGGPVLHALDATNLSNEFYNSTQAQTNGTARDAVHATDKYAVPVVANGHLYIGTKSGVDVFGVMP